MAGFDRLAIVEDEAEVPAPKADNAAAQRVLMFALAQLGKRSLAGVSDLFSLIGLGSVWALWFAALANPNTLQLIGISIYSAFLLVLEFIRRK